MTLNNTIKKFLFLSSNMAFFLPVEATHPPISQNVCMVNKTEALFIKSDEDGYN